MWKPFKRCVIFCFFELHCNIFNLLQHCQKLFIKCKADAYKHVTENHSRLKELQSEIKSLSIEKSLLDDTWTEFSKDLYETEQRWNFLLMLQVLAYSFYNLKFKKLS